MKEFNGRYLVSWHSKRDDRIYYRICDNYTQAKFWAGRLVRSQYVYRRSVKIEQY